MNSPEQFRLFIALSVPSDVKDRIERAQRELAKVLPAKAARWTRREQFHLTLRFLGNVAVSQVDDLARAAKAACQPFGPLKLTAAEVGFFPNSRSPHVLWVGVKDSDGKLPALWTALQTATQPFTNEAAEKNFTGHITLARLNRLHRGQCEDLGAAAAQYQQMVFGSWLCGHLEIMRSELLPQGARHSMLAELPLAGC